MKRSFCLLLLALAAAAAALLAPSLTAQSVERRPAAERSRPNIVVIMTDDQTVENTRVMRNTKRLIAAEGATFTNSIVSYALCCPSRATFFSGQYAHNHRVLNNKAPYGGYGRFHAKTSLPVWLRQGGYYTAHVGKFLNGYGRTKPRQVPAGWNDWFGTVDPTTYRYWNYTMNENGTLVRYGGRMRDYQTDVTTRLAVEAIERHATKPKPLFLNVAYMAPHSGSPVAIDDPPRMLTPEPAPRHRDRFVFEPVPNVPSYDEENLKDKPVGIRRRKPLEDYVAFAITENYQQRLESLLAVDEGVAAIVRALETTGELDNTVIIFTTDNGYFHGEHRIANGKVLPYEEALRVPLFVRGPGIKAGLVLPELVANIDLAPTIAELARVPPGRIVDGVSLVGLMRTGGWSVNRDSIVVEGGPFDKPSQEFSGIRTLRWQYSEYGNGDEELYDLVSDPYELENRAKDPDYADTLADMKRRLERLRLCSGAACRP
ncbi:MAG: sulfatase [Gaiellaceae bacterium]